MNVLDIISKWLKDNNFDGLVNPEQECCCPIRDLRPCCEDITDCEPGKNCPSEDLNSVNCSEEQHDKCGCKIGGDGLMFTEEKYRELFRGKNKPSEY